MVSFFITNLMYLQCYMIRSEHHQDKLGSAEFGDFNKLLEEKYPRSLEN